MESLIHKFLSSHSDLSFKTCATRTSSGPMHGFGVGLPCRWDNDDEYDYHDDDDGDGDDDGGSGGDS